MRTALLRAYGVAMLRFFAAWMGLFATAVVGVACPGRDAATSRESRDTTTAPDAAVGASSNGDAAADTADMGPGASAGALSWTEHVRSGRFQEAERGISGLSAEERARPEVRYAYARVALALGKAELALRLLERLEDDWPLVRDRVLLARSEAELKGAAYAKAAEYLGTRTTPAAWLAAAQAWEKAGESAKARTLSDRVVSADKHTAAQEEKARAIRARIALAKEGEGAAALDVRWLAIHALDDATAAFAFDVLGNVASSARDGKGRDAPSRQTMAPMGGPTGSVVAGSSAHAQVDARDANGATGAGGAGGTSGANATAGFRAALAAASPKLLDGADWLVRSRVLAEAGRADDALLAAARAESAKTPPSAVDLCRARAEAYYKARTRYPEAALTYRKCSALGGSHAAEDEFLSARAFSRADRDGDALPAFAGVIQHHPKTTWAEQAEFHIARTHALAGRWQDAGRAFDEYVKHAPGGHDKQEAERYRAIAHLLADEPKTARKLLENLAGAADSADSVTQARYANLAAVAALADGDRTSAIARFTEVARSRPLTWPALVARARLASLSAATPPIIDPPETDTRQPPLAVTLPPPVDLLHRVGLDGEAEDALREREPVVLGAAAGRGTEALCGAYGFLSRAKRRYQVALGVPASLLGIAPGSKNRWAWECAFPRPHADDIRASAAANAIGPELLWAVMRQESAFDPDALSPARAVGLMQLMPETAKTVAARSSAGAGADDDLPLTSPALNIALGAAYLKELLSRFRGNVPLAVAAYNAGPEAITRWQSRARAESLDVFVETIPFVETRGYVVRVMGNLARYGFLERGEGGVPSISLDLK